MVDIVSVAPKIFPKSRIGEFAPYWEAALAYGGIDTDDKLRLFLAQTGHECANYTRFEENLNYDAYRLAEVWPNRYGIRKEGISEYVKVYIGGRWRGKPNDLALQIQGDPQEIANRTYANRMGNGSYKSGDGWRYRGRGILMNTGRAQYSLLTKDLWPIIKVDLLIDPDKLIEPEVALWAAVRFWKIHNLNKYASRGSAGIKESTIVINGGTTGIDKRLSLYNRILKFI